MRLLAISLVTLAILTCSTTFAADTDSAVSAAPAAECRLELELPAVLKKGEYPPATISIVNAGKSPVVLVQPGDGSDCGWRTPLVGWSVLPVDSSSAHPLRHSPRKGARCGNINALGPAEVFELKPNERKSIGEWIGLPQLTKPGKYRVVVYYVNVPNTQWKGIPLGKHDEAAMERVRTSTPVAVRSNEVLVEFVE